MLTNCQNSFTDRLVIKYATVWTRH